MHIGYAHFCYWITTNQIHHLGKKEEVVESQKWGGPYRDHRRERVKRKNICKKFKENIIKKMKEIIKKKSFKNINLSQAGPTTFVVSEL